ncbi:MAG: hypothetical protein ACTSSH_07545 [Candidatus Heimdallarchaeota archaeon]
MNKLDFTTTLTETQSYIGEQAGQYVLAAFLQNKTADAGVRIETDIIKSKFVAKLTGTSLVKGGAGTSGNCDFTASGTIVAGEVELTPKPMWINIELCYEDLEALWSGLNSGDLNARGLTDDFNGALQGVLIDAMNSAFEDAVWNGIYDATGVTTNSLFDGIETQITTNVVTSGATFSKTNIVGFVDQLVEKLPVTVLEHKDELKIWMNPKSALYYRQALMALGYNTMGDATTNTLTTYDGIDIVELVKIADGEMFAFIPTNVALGVGAMDNFSQVSILDMREHTLDNSIRMAIQGKATVGVIFEAEAAKFI